MGYKRGEAHRKSKQKSHAREVGSHRVSKAWIISYSHAYITSKFFTFNKIIWVTKSGRVMRMKGMLDLTGQLSTWFVQEYIAIWMKRMMLSDLAHDSWNKERHSSQNTDTQYSLVSSPYHTCWVLSVECQTINHHNQNQTYQV